jgi:hypothetical protein
MMVIGIKYNECIVCCDGLVSALEKKHHKTQKYLSLSGIREDIILLFGLGCC